MVDVNRINEKTISKLFFLFDSLIFFKSLSMLLILFPVSIVEFIVFLLNIDVI